MVIGNVVVWNCVMGGKNCWVFVIEVMIIVGLLCNKVFKVWICCVCDFGEFVVIFVVIIFLVGNKKIWFLFKRFVKLFISWFVWKLLLVMISNECVNWWNSVFK